MAVSVEHKFEMTRTSEYLMNPLDIFVDPALDVRHTHVPVDDLIEDMLSKPDGKSIKGQTQPILVRKNNKGQFTIICGRRRWEAISRINKEKLAPIPMQIRCVYSQADDVEALAMALAENYHRADMGPMDYAYCVKQFIRFGKDHKWIALNAGFFPSLAKRVNGDDKHADLKKAVGQVKKWEALLSLSPEAGQAVAEGKVSETRAQKLAKLSADQQRQIIKESKGGAVSASAISGAAPKPAKMSFANFKKALVEAANSLKTPDGKPISRDVADWLVEFCEKA